MTVHNNIGTSESGSTGRQLGGRWRGWLGAVFVAAIGAATCVARAQVPTISHPANGAGRAAMADDFYFGADFPANVSANIKALFYETGMNCIRITGGGYGWATPGHKALADEFQTRGLNVYLQLGSHWPSGGYLDLKNSRLVDQAGQSGVEDRKSWSVSYSNNSWPQYSYASEDFRKKLEGDFTEYLGHFAENKNVAGVILHNEAGYFWLSDRVFDSSAPAVAKYRLWLAQEHGTIATLNARWGRDYKSFDEVAPPTKLPPVENMAAWLDWRRFNVVLIGDFLQWEAGFFKGQRGDVARTTNLSGPLDHWFAYRLSELYTYSKPMDRVGIDIYPAAWTDRVFVPYSMDATQGVAQGRPAQVLECEVFGTRSWKQFSEGERADLLRGELWTMIGHGSKGILMWGFSREDDFSLTDGEFNERVGACRDIAHETKMIGLAKFARPRPEVAVCVDPEAYVYMAGKEAKPNSETPQLDVEVHGLYAAVADSHIPADVIMAAQLRAGETKGYRALVVTSAMLMDEAMAKQLEQFVSGGGTVIVSGPLATMDRWGKRFETVPGYGLDRVFGVRSSEVNDKGGDVIASQVKIGTSTVTEHFTLTGATAVGTLKDGSPGFTVHAYGKGKAVWLAGRVGGSYLNNPGQTGLRTAMAGLLEQAGVVSRVTEKQEGGDNVDSSLLVDGQGNELVVATVSGNKGKLPATARQVTVGLTFERNDSHYSAFELIPLQVQDGRVKSGVQKLAMVTKGKVATLPLGDVSGARAVVVARDIGPLLATEGPAKAGRGKEATVSVTCYNVSPRKVAGAVAWRLPEGWTVVGDVPAVAVGMYGEQVVTCRLNVPADAKTGRQVLGATLTGNGGLEVVGAPVDVQVEE